MKIKKLTLAAAIAMSLMAVATPSVWAGCSDCGTPVGSACPLNGCPQTITPENAPCPVCNLPKCDCKCKSDCGCQEAAPCDECQAAAPCDTSKTSSCDTCSSPSCNPVAKPATASCPNTPQCGKNMLDKQVYAYPGAIYGPAKQSVIGEGRNSVAFSEAPIVGAAAPYMGVMVAEDSASCGCTTGAAAGIPILGLGIDPGVKVQRNASQMDGAQCPIEVCSPCSTQAIKRSVVPYAIPSDITGAAAPYTSSMFDDVPMDFWAACDINRLAETKVLAGYPDRTYKPNLPISRAEFASVIVNGYNLDKMACKKGPHHFKDLKKGFWANKYIETGVETGYMIGYPDNTFKPHHPVSRAEALTMLAQGINCAMDECQADQILSKYCDANEVPSFAKIPIAKALESGALKNFPQPNVLAPNKDASRAEVASMVQDLRVAMGYDAAQPKTALTEDCGCTTGAAAYMEKDTIVDLPTLQLQMKDIINSKNAHVGDHFAAKTLAPITINGQTFPEGSNVYGTVSEVVRPNRNCEGAIRLSFNEIKNDKCKAELPNQVLTAQVNKCKNANAFARLVAAPFTWVGSVLGDAGRTVGGAATSIANSTESVFSGVGTGTGELLTGQFGAFGRSYMDAGKALVMAPVDLGRNALSGVAGVFNTTQDEVAYLVDPNGYKISQVNPKEKVTISFGCK